MNLPLSPTGKWSVSHGMDFQADIVGSKNMDFGRAGYAALAKKTTVLMTEDTDDSFGIVMAVVAISVGTSTTYHFITSEQSFSWDASTSPFTDTSTGVANAPSFNINSDAVSYLGLLTASGTQTIASFHAGGWNERVTDLQSAYPHPLAVFENRRTLCYADQNVVYQTGVENYTPDSANQLNIPAEYVITGLRWRQNNLYIATRALNAGNAKLFIWNGSGIEAQYAYEVNADWIYSMAVGFQSSVVVLTSAGQLLRFNGGGFDELPGGNFPVYGTDYEWSSNNSLQSSIGRCANRGMIADGDILYINIDGGLQSNARDFPGPFLPTQPSGLWVYDPQVGLSHRGSTGYDRYTETAFDFGSSNFVFPAPHLMETGDPVLFTDVSGLAGLDANQLYFAIRNDETSVKVARTLTDAMNGDYIAVTGTPSEGARIVAATYSTMGTTCGAGGSIRPGAVGLFLVDPELPAMLGSGVMFGGEVTKPDGSTSISALMSFGLGHNRGYFVTTPIPSSAVTDQFQKLIQVIEDLDLGVDQVIVKYRTRPRLDLPTQYSRNSTGQAVWVDGTHFTIDITAKTFPVQEGDEIEIIEGAGAGYLAHIKSITTADAIWTVELDEAIPGIVADDRSEVIADNWKKVSVTVPESDGTAYRFGDTTVGEQGSSVQFKVELRGQDVAIRRFMSVSKPEQQVA